MKYTSFKLSLIICSITLLIVIHVSATIGAASNNTITYPLANTVLPVDVNGNVTFRWQADNSTNAPQYAVFVGHWPGGYDITWSGILNSGTDHWSTNKIPLDGSTIWVEMIYSSGGQWYYDEERLYMCPTAKTEITTPPLGANLLNGQPIQWNYAGQYDYIVLVTRSSDNTLIEHSATLTGICSWSATKLPNDGQYVVVRLYYKSYTGVGAHNSYEWVLADKKTYQNKKQDDSDKLYINITSKVPINLNCWSDSADGSNYSHGPHDAIPGGGSITVNEKQIYMVVSGKCSEECTADVCHNANIYIQLKTPDHCANGDSRLQVEVHNSAGQSVSCKGVVPCNDYGNGCCEYEPADISVYRCMTNGQPKLIGVTCTQSPLY
jgi:hypothetical protein